MDAAVVAETARHILHSEPPKKVVKLAESLALQSSTSIPLKPNTEPARIYICCVLAIERLSSQLALSAPDTQKPPVPPQAYVRLLDQFRQTLLQLPPPEQQGNVGRPASGQGGRHPTRAARRKATLQLQDDGTAAASDASAITAGPASHGGGADNSDMPSLGGTYGADSDDDHYEGSDDEANQSGYSLPHKRAPGASSDRAGSAKGATPRKRAKSALPTSHVIDEIGNLMSLAAETIDAVRHAFDQYRELVKDQWGLVYGLFAVISERAEPRMGSDNLKSLDRALRDVAPQRLHVDPNEWVPWVERIVTGQTWITKISERPEPAPKLVGAPGGWGLGVEFALVDDA